MLSRVTCCLIFAAVTALTSAARAPIDRQALVTRHDPVLRQIDVDAPLTVGNGGFAFGADITGLQTFPEHYQHTGIPIETLSRWCWVSDQNPNHYTLADASKDFTQADGQVVPYPTKSTSPAGDWLRKNPRNHPLGLLALDWQKDDGSAFLPADIQVPEQTLDLWRGVITSRFKLGGRSVVVTTACAPDSDTIGVRIESELVAEGKLRARLSFPRGHDLALKNTPALDWSQPESHTSTLIKPTVIARHVLDTTYYVATDRPLTSTAPHTFRISGTQGSSVLEFTLSFSPRLPDSVGSDRSVPSAQSIFSASAGHWQKFWSESAAVDFTGSTDPRAHAIEERIIRSRYLMAVQMAGDVPPQETGLTCSRRPDSPAARGTANITPR